MESFEEFVRMQAYFRKFSFLLLLLLLCTESLCLSLSTPPPWHRRASSDSSPCLSLLSLSLSLSLSLMFDHEFFYDQASSAILEAFSLLQKASMSSPSSYHRFRHSSVAVAVAITAVAGVAVAVAIYNHKSSFIKRRRKRTPLTQKQWHDGFDSASGRLTDPRKMLRRVRFGGIDPCIRAEVWLFLLGFYELDSTRGEREQEKSRKREVYRDLKIQCNLLRGSILESSEGSENLSSLMEVQNISITKETLESRNDSQGSSEGNSDEDCNKEPIQTSNLLGSNKVTMSIGSEEEGKSEGKVILLESNKVEVAENVWFKDDGGESKEATISLASNEVKAVESLNSYEGEESKERTASLLASNIVVENVGSEDEESKANVTPHATNIVVENVGSKEEESNVKITPHATNKLKVVKEDVSKASEDFITWQRIIRLDAVRMNAEWVPYSPSQANVTQKVAWELASSVGLKDDEHLEPCRQHHAARLVSILEAYALYDPEIGYCQGMSDLLSPFVALLDEDYEAFWCFVQFMSTARHNFRRDEVGIRRQLNKIANIFRIGDLGLYSHFEKMQAEDCFFVYRMVVVLLRRELTFEQTISLWEVIWAEKKDVTLGDIKSSRSWKMKKRQKSTDDLILFVIVAAVRQRRKVILAKCNGLDEILRECNSMAGHLDVWSLLDEARELLSIVNGRIRD